MMGASSRKSNTRYSPTLRGWRLFGGRRPTPVRAAIAAVGTLILVIVGFPNLQPAYAATSSIDQHWELLDETGTFSNSSSIPISRGTLPGGTTKFDPAPTVTLEVVGRHTGGSGASRWDVALGNGGTTLASVSFNASDSTYRLKTVPFTSSWPTTDKLMTYISVTKVNDGLNLAGTFEITKAYLSIRQTGVIKKTVTRIALATKQTNITNTGWVDVADPIYYQHVAGDFNPTPTVTLRTSGVEITANPILMSLHVRLVDDAGNPVAGSENVHQAFGSLSSAPLSLVDGVRYHLQVCITAAPESGELHSADLVLEQSTTDPLGIVKAVGYYASVSAATTMTTNNSYLNYPMTPPQFAVTSSSTSWITVIQRLSGSSTVNAELRDPSAGILVAGGSSSTATTSSSYVVMSQSAITLPSASTSARWDSRALLGTGSTGRLATSALRIIFGLRALPVIYSLGADNLAFSPDANAVKDSATISALTKVDASSATWQLQIKYGSILVRTLTGTTACPLGCSDVAVSQPWNGLGENALHLPDGQYTVIGTITDSLGVTGLPSSPLTLTIDTAEPAATLYPAEGGETIFGSQPLIAAVSGTGSAISSATFTLNGDDASVSTVAATISTSWVYSAPQTLAVGHRYAMSLLVNDAAGNSATIAQASPLSGGGFLVTSATPNVNATAFVPATSCTLGAINTSTQSRPVTCSHVPLVFNHTSVDLGPVTHAGVGFLQQQVSLQSALLTSNSGSTTSAYQSSDPSWAPRWGVSRFEVPVSSTTATTRQAAQSITEMASLTASVPSTWTSATLSMSSVVATSRQLAACANPAVASGRNSCGPDPLTDALTSGWQPDLNDVHIQSCDSVLSTRVPSVLTPGANASLTVTVDQSRFAPSSASLLYRTNMGSLQTLSISGAQATYAFTIPAAQLGEGTNVEYAFVARGAFTDSGCTSVSAALFPTASSLQARATADQASTNDQLQSAEAASMQAIVDQFAVPSTTPVSSICTQYFTSPTPCDLFANSTQADLALPNIPTAAANVFRGSTPQSAGPDCQKTFVAKKGSGFFFYKTDNSTSAADPGGNNYAKNVASLDTSNSAAKLSATARANGPFPIYAVSGSATTALRSRTGYAFQLQCFNYLASENCPLEPVAVELDYNVNGWQHVTDQAGQESIFSASCDLGYPSLPTCLTASAQLSSPAVTGSVEDIPPGNSTGYVDRKPMPDYLGPSCSYNASAGPILESAPCGQPGLGWAYKSGNRTLSWSPSYLATNDTYAYSAELLISAEAHASQEKIITAQDHLNGSGTTTATRGWVQATEMRVTLLDNYACWMAGTPM